MIPEPASPTRGGERSAEAGTPLTQHRWERRLGAVDRESAGPRRWAHARDYLTLAAAGFLGLVGLLALLAPLIAEHGFGTTPDRIDLGLRFQPPGEGHWLGTDENGRDQLVRLLYGARISLSIGLLAALINLVVGLVVGAVAAYYGGIVDDAITWLINTLRAIPAIFLFILIGALFRPSVAILTVSLGLFYWTGVARLVRGQVLSLKQRDYVTAARALGAGDTRLIARHILPNVLPLAIVVMGIDVAGIILLESVLSFVGFGVQPPTASWGSMLTNAQQYWARAPWLVLGPGVLIWTTVLACYLVADGLRDALDPTLKR